MKIYFTRVEEPQYKKKMITVLDKRFAEIIKVEKILEEYLRNRSITGLESLEATNKSSQSGGT